MIRHATPDDIPIAAEWWFERNRGDRMMVEALPAIGCVCEDDAGPVGMGWLYLDNSKGVAFIEHMVMRPGISLADANATGMQLLAGLEAAAAALNYTVIVAYALPACARLMRSAGYYEGDQRLKVAMIKTL